MEDKANCSEWNGVSEEEIDKGGIAEVKSNKMTVGGRQE